MVQQINTEALSLLRLMQSLYEADLIETAPEWALSLRKTIAEMEAALRALTQRLAAQTDEQTIVEICERIGFGRVQQIAGHAWEQRHHCAPRGRMGVTVRNEKPAPQQATPSRFGSPDLQALIVQHATQQATPEPDRDGEAFRTAARLGLTLRFYGGCAQSGMPGSPSAYEVVSAGGDPAAAMREAVERAAAVIQAGGEAQKLATPEPVVAMPTAPSDQQILNGAKEINRLRAGSCHMSESDHWSLYGNDCIINSGKILKAAMVGRITANDMRADPDSLRSRLQTWPEAERVKEFGDLFAITPEPVGEPAGPKLWWLCEAADLSSGAVWTRQPDADDVAWVSNETKRPHVALRLVPEGNTRPAPGVPEGWREVIEKMVKGIDHLAELARQWEPDYSSGADRKGWVLAKNARDEAVDMLAAAQAKGGAA